MPRPYLYLNLSPHIHLRWRGSSAEHVCWRRSAVRWEWGRTGPFRRATAAMPSPSEPGPSLHWRPLGLAALGRYSSGVRGTTAVRPGALEPPVGVSQLKEQKTRACAPRRFPPRVVELRPVVFRLDAHIPQSLNSTLIPCLYGIVCKRAASQALGITGKEPACSLIWRPPSQILCLAVIPSLVFGCH
jgi:hypothetical protein